MLKFGKKINYRPILISLVFALIPSFIFGSIMENLLLGISIGVVAFLGMIFIYYYPNIPTLFNYWEVSDGKINYIDLDDKKNRLLGMFTPSAVHVKTISINEVDSIDLVGDLNNKFEMPLAIPYSGYLAVLSPVISIINHPVDVKLHLNNGQIITLSLARDYTYSQKNAISKLTKFLDLFDKTSVKIIRPTNNKVSLG